MVDSGSGGEAGESRLQKDALQELALKLLAARDYAEKELRARLSGRAASEADVDSILSRMKELGFLNESRFANRKAEEAAGRRLVGKRRVKRELEDRELSDALITNAVEAAYQGKSEAGMALAHLETRLAGLLRPPGLEDERTLRRAYGRLRRAGFGHADTVSALRAHSRLADTLDEFDSGDET